MGLYPELECMTTDVCVPVSRLSDLIGQSKRELDASPLPAPIVAHAVRLLLLLLLLLLRLLMMHFILCESSLENGIRHASVQAEAKERADKRNMKHEHDGAIRWLKPGRRRLRVCVLEETATDREDAFCSMRVGVFVRRIVVSRAHVICLFVHERAFDLERCSASCHTLL